MLTIRIDYERTNGRYTNAEYRGKITCCDLTLNIKYRPVRRGGHMQQIDYSGLPVTDWSIVSKYIELNGKCMFNSIFLKE